MNETEIFSYLVSPPTMVGLIIAFAEALKILGLPPKYLPLFDVILGVIIDLLVYGLELGFGVLKSGVIGLALGLSACGLFSGIKNTIS